MVTDDSGNEVSRVQYSPYGAIIEQSGSLPTDRLYTGQRFESGLELYDYRARFYDPLTSNFLSPDTIVPDFARPASFNRYSYVYNNPVRYTDPSGHCPECFSNFGQGFFYEITANNYDALLIPTHSPFRREAEALAADQQDNVYFQLGRLTGALGNVAQGLGEIQGGITMIGGGAAGGTVSAPTGVGAVAGYGTAVAGVGLTAHGGMVAGQGAIGVGDALGSTVMAIFGRGRGGGKPTVINTSQGPLLSLQNKGDTKRFVQKYWYRGTFNSELDSAAYHLNKHAPDLTIQEYTLEAQTFFRSNWKSGQVIQSYDGSIKLLRIDIESGHGIFTLEGQIVTFQPK